MKDGEILLSDAVGYVDGTKQKPVTTNTLYNIGSVSKVVCAAAIMKLVDEGKVKLDDPVISYLPEFKMEDDRYKNKQGTARESK
jgi:CubicO group peptidase (beta-lactamase class C family)